jgi:hypothetical protein
MSEPTLRFSLRSLFTATTQIAILFSMVAIHPAVLIASLVLLSPILFVVAKLPICFHSRPQRHTPITVARPCLFARSFC